MKATHVKIQLTRSARKRLVSTIEPSKYNLLVSSLCLQMAQRVPLYGEGMAAAKLDQRVFARLLHIHLPAVVVLCTLESS
jgi:hypothetical protein